MHFFLALALALGSSCGAPHAAPPPPSNRSTTPAGLRNQRAIALLRALSSALRHDQPLAPLIDPHDGTWIWQQPGAVVSPSVHLAPGDARRPSEIIAASGWTDGAKEGWATGLAEAIDLGLAVVDVDGDPALAIYYTDCGDDKMPPPSRALLITKGVDLRRTEPGADDAQLAGLTAPLGFHFRFGTASVYLSERDGVLAVAHLLQWAPCDA